MSKTLEALEYTFRISKRISFEVRYGKNKSNQYFATSANLLNYRRTDFDQCGQAQESLLLKGSVARKFYEKWDSKHLQALTESEYNEMFEDLELLKNTYGYIESGYFGDIVALDRRLSK